MGFTREEYNKIKDILPVQRGNVRIDNFKFMQALVYIAENGCKWRALPTEFGNWNTIFRRMYRWAKSGVFNKIFQVCRSERLEETTLMFLDSTSIKVHPHGVGALKKMVDSLLANPAEG